MQVLGVGAEDTRSGRRRGSHPSVALDEYSEIPCASPSATSPIEFLKDPLEEISRVFLLVDDSAQV